MVATMRTLQLLLVASAACAVLPGCSNEMVYHSVQGWQQQQCQRRLDRDDRSRCERSNARSYEDYQGEVAATKKSSQ